MHHAGDDLPENGLFEEKFGPREYLLTYYPHDVDVQGLFSILQTLRERISPQGAVDIARIVDGLGVLPETIENLFILDFQKTVLKHLSVMCPKGDATILEVGGGPTIYQHIALSLAAKHIIHSEFLEGNRREVHLWLREEEGAYNWDPYFHLMRMILAEDNDYQTFLAEYAVAEDPLIRAHAETQQRILSNEDISLYKERVRRCLKGVTAFGDLFHPNLGWEMPVTQEWVLDLVVSNFGVESATDSRAKWEEGMRNLMHFVRPGGLFSVSAIRNAHWYQVGRERLPAVSINEADLSNICLEEGFEILETRVLMGSPREVVGYDGMVFILARKKVPLPSLE